MNIQTHRVMHNLSECGFGVCAGDSQCRDKHCPDHPCKSGMMSLPVIDVKYFDDQIKGNMQIEMIEPNPFVVLWVEYVKTAILAMSAIAALGYVLYLSMK